MSEKEFRLNVILAILAVICGMFIAYVLNIYTLSTAHAVNTPDPACYEYCYLSCGEDLQCFHRCIYWECAEL